jgi:tRNA-modifying protein YgfZ
MIQEQWQTYLTGAADQAPPQDDTEERSGGGIACLADLTAVRFTGPDVRKFLQGYLTCDINDLQPGVLTPAALCNLKGRVVMNGWCTAEHQDIVLVLHRSLAEDLGAFLRAYLMFSKTRLTLPEVLIFGSLDRSEPAHGLVIDERRRLFLCDDLAEAKRLWEAAPHLPEQAWLAALTADGIPLVSKPVSQTFLPQMLNLESLGAIDFAKGCYLGQEVVARAQHRGQVKRRLARLAWTGNEAPAAGAEILDGHQRPAGVVVQSAATSADGGVLLAVLQQEAAPPLLQGAVRLEPIA